MKERYIKSSLRKRTLGIIEIVVVLMALSTVASAIPFQVGDVFAAVGNGNVQHYDKNGNLLETLNTGLGGFTTGMAFDSNGNLYVTNFDKTNVAKFDDTGTLLGMFGSGYNGKPESILFDASGNAYVGAVDGDNDVRKFDAGGTPIGQFNVATEDRGSDWIDLAADQCTLFYTSEGSLVKRFDVCANAQLPDFATLDHSPAYALRLLPGGGALVADSVDIHRLDSSGNIVQTYDAPGQNTWFALNIDPDGTSFWSGDYTTGHFFKFDMASGNVLMDVNTGTSLTSSTCMCGLTVFGEQTIALGSISGQKFNDLNGNGVKDMGELGLSGWTIELTKPDGTKLTQLTDQDGNYNFGSLLIGTYTVGEVLKSGWKQTAPVGGTYTVPISAGEHVTGKDFGNINVGSIAGIKFDDVNGNGVNDGEPGLQGWTITLSNQSGIVATQITSPTGSYNFTNLTADNYTVSEVLQSGWIQTAPKPVPPGTYTVNLSAGENVIGKDFGNFKLGEVHGMKFEDLNANGTKEAFETGLAGWEINIKGTDTITGEEVNITTTTDANGKYSFLNLTNGTYVISETLKDGWVQTAPVTSTYTVTINSGTVVTGQDFGNFHKGKITGIGWIPADDQKATFGLVGQYPANSNTAQGNVEVQDHSANLNIKSIQINTVATTVDKKKGVIT